MWAGALAMVLKFVTGFGARGRSSEAATPAAANTTADLPKEEETHRGRKGGKGRWFVQRPKHRFRNAPEEFQKVRRGGAAMVGSRETKDWLGKDHVVTERSELHFC